MRAAERESRSARWAAGQDSQDSWGRSVFYSSRTNRTQLWGGRVHAHAHRWAPAQTAAERRQWPHLWARTVAEGRPGRVEGCQAVRVFLPPLSGVVQRAMPNRDPRLQCRVHCSYPVGQKSARHLASFHPTRPTFCDRALAQRRLQARERALARRSAPICYTVVAKLGGGILEA